MIRVGIINYGQGNLFSLSKAFTKIGYDSVITEDIRVLNTCTHLVLPGVGAFSSAMEKLEKLKLDTFVKEASDKKVPILGICLGAQVLFNSSLENGFNKGLQILDGQVVPFEKSLVQKTLNVGWREVSLKNGSVKESQFNSLKTIDKNSFYFVHKFYIKCSNKHDNIFQSYNGSKIFDAVVERDNILAVQFHPEKSRNIGLELLLNFIRKNEK